MKPFALLFALVACLASPPGAAQIFSWDPLKDVENALPEGVPNVSRIIRARLQIREMSLSNFIDQGWEFGGQANLSAMVGGQGGQFNGAAAVSPGVYLYQLTNTGLSATITVSGTKYFKDSDLN